MFEPHLRLNSEFVQEVKRITERATKAPLFSMAGMQGVPCCPSGLAKETWAEIS